jgi:thiol-disulfide isomerase/thioredoxin
MSDGIGVIPTLAPGDASPRGRRLRHLIPAAALIALSAAHGLASELPGNFIRHDTPKPVAEIRFEDDQGRTRSLADFRGKVVLLNIWATWCGPCRREMPSLDRLQAALGGSDFQVLPLSIDRAGVAVVRKFYADVGLKNLPIYIDTAGKATRELATVGVPATLLIDREGREVGRLVGPAEWDEPAIVSFLKSVIARKQAKSREEPSKMQLEGIT